MTTNQMRMVLSDVYPGKNWKEKIRKMPENQVVAIYYSFLKQGKFDKKKEDYHQITMFEFMERKES